MYSAAPVRTRSGEFIFTSSFTKRWVFTGRAGCANRVVGILGGFFGTIVKLHQNVSNTDMQKSFEEISRYGVQFKLRT